MAYFNATLQKRELELWCGFSYYSVGSNENLRLDNLAKLVSWRGVRSVGSDKVGQGRMGQEPTVASSLIAIWNYTTITLIKGVHGYATFKAVWWSLMKLFRKYATVVILRRPKIYFRKIWQKRQKWAHAFQNKSSRPNSAFLYNFFSMVNNWLISYMHCKNGIVNSDSTNMSNNWSERKGKKNNNLCTEF